jgi:hypothetical protein
VVQKFGNELGKVEYAVVRVNVGLSIADDKPPPFYLACKNMITHEHEPYGQGNRVCGMFIMGYCRKCFISFRQPYQESESKPWLTEPCIAVLVVLSKTGSQGTQFRLRPFASGLYSLTDFSGRFVLSTTLSDPTGTIYATGSLQFSLSIRYLASNNFAFHPSNSV